MWGWGFILLGLLVGCGSDNAPISEKPSPLSIVAPSADPAEKLIAGEGFDGALVLQFDSASSPTINEVQTIVEQASLKLRRLSETTSEQVEKRRQELERLSGKQLEDVNRFFVIEVHDANTAFHLYRKLKDHSGITRLYPRTKVTPTSLANTPDLSGMTAGMPEENIQGYLYPLNPRGGLNVVAAWQRGVRGQGVWLVDNEPGVFTNHEDLPLRSQHLMSSICDDLEADPLCPRAVAHGAAMVGIMAALDNGRGMTGIAPSSIMKAAGTDGGPGTSLQGLVDDGLIPPGTVFTMIYGPVGPLGDVPVAADAVGFAAIEQATAAGITVIEAAGNSSLSLDRDDAYYSWQHNLNREDTSAIIVGASLGRFGRNKAPFSNWGRQVSLHAWGAGVVTTSYNPNRPTSAEPCALTTPLNPYAWYGTTSPIPPNNDPQSCFADSVAGTSPATAMIAASAALLQSHAKQQMAPSGAALTRYLMPHRIKQMLVDSGNPQIGNDGNIGHQPDVGVALNLFDQFWNRIRSQYPELVNNTQLTEERMLTLRRQEGIGLLCGRADAQQHRIVGDHDPSCPEQELWPTGNYIAKNLDFDGDGRADLVSATNGEWKLDLSSQASTTNTPDNFGSWDVTITFPRLPGRWVWPYTEDMNSDGRSDIVVYDKERGKWFIEFTTTDLLNGRAWDGWDFQVDYSTSWHDTLEMDPWQSKYSRPHPGDYNADGLIDIAIACSDGMWRIDYQNEGTWDGVFDREVRYLDDQRLRDAPGWAYVTFAADFNSVGAQYPGYKIPDTLPEEGDLVIHSPLTSTTPGAPLNWDIPPIYGGNDSIILPGAYDGSVFLDVGIKHNQGEWNIALRINEFQQLTALPPSDGYGGLGCHPIVSDFDGDDREDRAVMCKDEWRIEYTGNPFPAMMGSDDIRHVTLGYDEQRLSLPGRSYAGGLSYERVMELIDFTQRLHPAEPPPIPVDMATVSYIP